MSGPGPGWPADDAGGPLGDGRHAARTEHPATVAQVQAAVRAAVAEGLAVYPQGGGTALDYGGVPARPGVAVRLGRLDRVVDYPVADMTITVEAGMTLAAVRDLVGRHGQRLAIEAADPERATLGGIFATAATGPCRFGWGRPRDQIIGVAFVTGAGELVRGGGRVVKNVAGYDFPKLLTGSLGTLGIITELTLKVNPRPESSALVAVDFADLDHAASALDRLNLSGARPVALELVDNMADVGERWGLMIGLEGNRAAVEWQVDRLEAELGRPARWIRRDGDADAAWLDFVQDEGDAAGGLGFSASFAPSQVPAFLAAVDHDSWYVRAHAGNGVVRARARAVAGFEASPTRWEEELSQLRAAVNRLGGSLILSACPTAWKGRLGVWGPRRPDWALAERVKAALDPGHVLNPGRFVGSI